MQGRDFRLTDVYGRVVRNCFLRISIKLRIKFQKSRLKYSNLRQCRVLLEFNSGSAFEVVKCLQDLTDSCYF